ncbi:MAG: hypothetical protein Q9O74_06635 [Planctomycetota bacterium]|nr:hypothetical protein [Planctomycetota bacterium]
MQWVGPFSNISTPSFRRITDRETWTTLWALHRGDLADRSRRGRVMPPEIDFDRYMVLARFTGESAYNNGEAASSVFRRGNAVVLRFGSRTYQAVMSGPTIRRSRLPFPTASGSSNALTARSSSKKTTTAVSAAIRSGKRFTDLPH